ncbi:MAG: hypothetical protein ACYS7M_05270, partial [Planctomycetota bacterium]
MARSDILNHDGRLRIMESKDSPATIEYRSDASFAQRLDAEDPLGGLREQFHQPRRADGRPIVYFCGNSLGLQPKGVSDIVNGELRDWANLGVEAHFQGQNP